MADNDGFFTVTNKKRKRTKDADMESDTKRPCIKPQSEVMVEAEGSNCHLPQQATGSAEQRVIRVPPNRYTALKNNWIKLTAPIKDILRLDIKFNTASRQVEIRCCDPWWCGAVKMLSGDHVNRAIGRMAGKGGRTRYTIENATKTRIIIDN
ncbi:PNO1, partial [Cordylochernes scorpioides]